MLTEFLGTEVTFALPEWFPPERLEYSWRRFYGPNHIWAGQVEETCYDNSAVKALFRLKGVKQVDYGMGHWVVFELLGAPARLPHQIADAERRLTNFLKRYKESK